ncbi:hypothetical protein [Bosea sp. (in: a-proteobacteria)]|uniref:hypothetical protein n=1 Tax=Bosea sp. (in: a-proteobacteria) TaxID=1871050 RepID=UPI002B4A37E3|nr:hypothetical protein [Bosea sp. (in: a-proteobacteria)]WRH57991.1 MAG: hypothetical protein RSE11_24000 [Bosea sp. (in: a-proteobacteria)]
MLSNRIVAAIVGAVILAASAFAVAPASAAPVSTGLAQAAPAGDLVQEAQYYYGPRRHYGPRRYYGPPRYYSRPVYRPRCFFVDRRVWNGYRWVIRPVRVCR